ncbi:MgtC/SapB family protein [Ensifer soli]|uniref:MgtC/SapB family protein n=1 Tax=Ciceribacter sp. sgz301302 TaxID=3342379 RepID=UPI0035B9813F
MVARLLLAAILGALIGIEREWRDRPAGLKTHMMVCLASAVFTIVAIELVNAPPFAGENVQMDPSRLVEAITGGVAFLAAGFIVLSRGEVQGITTGAGMWLAGAVGLAAGLGLWQIAVTASVMALAIFVAIHRMQLVLRRGPPESAPLE